MSWTVRATVHQAPTPSELQTLHDVVITIDEAGLIASIEPHANVGDEADVTLGPDQRLLPGLVDTHIHAPQWPQLGTGLDLPLEEWLFVHTFPLEARFADLDFARDVWDDMVPALLRHGTTTAVYYGSVHLEATTALAEACIRYGQRAFVGRTAMDHPAGTPEWYRDVDAAAAVRDSRQSIEEIRALDSDLVQPIVTPRFIPACSDEALAGLGQLAAETDTLVQTHCSENDWEHGHVLERHGISDAASLDRFGLLRRGTVLAHGGLLGDDDLPLLAERGAGVAHCPLSNAYFGDAVFPARRAMTAGVHVGLGTDIAGGASPSVMFNAAHAVTSSRMLEDGVDPARPRSERGRADQRIDIVTAFHLATVGGAQLLGLPVGLLAVGRPFDAIAVATDGPGVHGARRWPEVDGPADDGVGDARIFEKIVRSTDASRIKRTWVQGTCVQDSSHD